MIMISYHHHHHQHKQQQPVNNINPSRVSTHHLLNVSSGSSTLINQLDDKLDAFMYPVGVNFIDRGPDGRGQILMVNETKEGMIMMTTIILTIMKVMEPNPRKKTQKDIQ